MSSAAGDFLPDGLVVRRASSRLWSTKAIFTVGPIMTSPLSGFSLPGDHAEQRRLAGAVRADDADDRARRHLEAQVVDQQAVAEGLA